MNRARKSDESFEEYRDSMRQEQADIDQHLRGRMVHASKEFIFVPGQELVSGGTFVPQPGVTYWRPL